LGNGINKLLEQFKRFFSIVEQIKVNKGMTGPSNIEGLRVGSFEDIIRLKLRIYQCKIAI
jgi:hypothetical protein